MTQWAHVQKRYVEQLGLQKPPVGIVILEREPTAIRKFTGAVAAGCGFWRIAANGDTFYTVPPDHFNCAIGSFTHSISE